MIYSIGENMARIKMVRRLSLALLLCTAASSNVLAKDYVSDIDFLPASQSYDDAVPAPSDVLGFVPGRWHARHDQIVGYVQRLAEASPRVRIKVLGKTYEDRTLLQLLISSPDNLERLESIQERHRELTRPAGKAVDTSDLPALISLNYSIHGNEPSGSNAALLVAYYLAAAQGERIDELLENTVVVLNPALNPDGLSLFTTWVNHHKGKHPVAYPLNREHTAVWPAGRMNHYLFNLNRDWLFLQQRETQILTSEMHNWLPQVVADFHETGTDTTAYFQPGVPNRVHPLTPVRNQELTAKLAEFSAAAYDEQGLLYYTKERFDDFYYGKSSTYADAIGSIGLTFEVGSSRGHLKDSVNGPVSFPLTIEKQVITSLAVLKGASALREELLDYQAGFFESALANAANDRTKMYIVGDDGDPQRLREFCRLLLRQGIDVFEVTRGVVEDQFEYRAGNAVAIPTNQTSYRLLKSLFERRTEFVEPVFYDISAWNAPMAFNLPFTELSTSRNVLGPPLALPLERDKLTPLRESGYAYVFSWKHDSAPSLLSDLLENNVKVRTATKPFSIQTVKGERSFGRGSIVIPVQQQDNLDESLIVVLQDAATLRGVEIFSVAGGLATAGIDLGSSNFKSVDPVRPLLLAGEGLSRTEVGEIWFLLDQQLDMPVPIVDVARFSDVELNDFTHLILVNGEYDALKEGRGRLESWLNAGGILIVQRGAAEWAQALFESDDNEREQELSIVESPGAGDPGSPQPYTSQEVDIRLEKIAGAILQVKIDASHPIGFSYERNEVAVMRQGEHVLPRLSNPYAHPGQYTDAPLLSGYVSDQNLENLRLSPAISAKKVGNGLIVSFADNPNFRGYFFGSSRLFTNALFFSQIVNYID